MSGLECIFSMTIGALCIFMSFAGFAPLAFVIEILWGLWLLFKLGVFNVGD